MFSYNKGIQITGTKLWLDAGKKVELSFISHAHRDHIRRHKQIIATDKTLSFYKKRLGFVKPIILNYGQSLEIEDLKIQLLPAGHILGSSQILIEKNGQRLLYTGDFRVKPGRTAEKIQIAEADILIMECTFGLPQYVFPASEEIQHKLLSFIENCFAKHSTPVILGYTLGKGQEALKLLGDLGFTARVYKPIFEFAKIYEQYGIQFGDYSLFEGIINQSEVLLMSPHAIYKLSRKKVPNQSRLILTGWAIDRGCAYRYDAHEALPMSDHAGYDELIDFVKQVRPKKVYTTHGPEQFSYLLRDMGFDAEPLNPIYQLALFS